MKTLKDHLLTPYTVLGRPISSADIQYVVKMLQKRPLFTIGWVESYLHTRQLGLDSCNRAADRILQRLRVLRLIKFDRGYWSWTDAGKGLQL